MVLAEPGEKSFSFMVRVGGRKKKAERISCKHIVPALHVFAPQIKMQGCSLEAWCRICEEKTEKLRIKKILLRLWRNVMCAGLP